MEAILKNGTTVEIDTKFLFNDQYNTVSGKRIFDGEIAAIRNDARVGMGRCRYCGAMVRRGEEEQHFRSRELNTCSRCFWKRRKLIDQKKNRLSETETKDDLGRPVVSVTENTTSVYTDVCTYGEGGHAKTDCTYKECRAYGIDWFTPENTFFLQKPNGFRLLPASGLEAAGFIPPVSREAAVKFNTTYLWRYEKKIGTYTLEACVRYENREPVGIEYFYIRNDRKHYSFRYENGKWFIRDPKFGYRCTDKLEGIPSDVVAKVAKIMACLSP